MSGTKKILGAALVLALAAAPGCGEEKKSSGGDKSAKAATSDKAKPAGTGAPAASGAAAPGPSASASANAAPDPATPAPAAAGNAMDLVKYMPKSCDDARAYMNLGRLAAISPGGSVTQAIEKANAADPKAGKVLQALKDAGVDLHKVLTGFALCVDKKDFAVALGVNLEGAKPLDEIFAKVAEASGDKKVPEKKEENGTTYYQMPKEKDAVLVVANPKVFLIGKKDAMMPLVKAPGDGAADFKIAADTLIWGTMKEKGNPLSVLLTDKSPNVEGKFEMSAPELAKLGKDSDKFVTEMKAKIEKATAGFASTPLKIVAEDAKLVKITVSGDTMKAELVIPVQHLTDLGKTLQDMKPEDFKKLRF